MTLSSIIIHLDVDNFYVSCHLLEDPSLAGRPVVIHQHNMGGIVALSDEAKALGIQPGEGIGRAGDKALKVRWIGNTYDALATHNHRRRRSSVATSIAAAAVSAAVAATATATTTTKRGGRSINELKKAHPELVALLMDAEGL